MDWNKPLPPFWDRSSHSCLDNPSQPIWEKPPSRPFWEQPPQPFWEKPSHSLSLDKPSHSFLDKPSNFAEGPDAVMKGVSTFHATEGKHYNMMFEKDLNSSRTTGMNVIDERLFSSKQIARGEQVNPKGDWIFRLDKPHRGAEFNHLNINPEISGKVDPHLKLPGKTLDAGVALGKGAKVLSKVATPVALTLDALKVADAVKLDRENNTTRNTVESVATAAGEWVGGAAGIANGAAVGTFICPGLGTIIGGIGGGVVGVVGGNKITKLAAETLGDAFNYDVVKSTCTKCGKEFDDPVYRTGGSGCCPSCTN